jgi:transcriptional regulator with XRE-family HTH domain
MYYVSYPKINIMIKNVFFYITLCLVILNMILLIKYKRIGDIYKEEEIMYKNGLSVLASKVAFYKSLYQISFNNNNCPVNLSQKVVSIKDTINLNDIFKKGDSFLVFKYSYQDCNTCIDKVYQKLDYYKDSLPYKTVVFTNQRNLRDLLSESSRNSKLIPVYSLSGNKLCETIDGIHSPILFILNEQHKISSIFKIQKMENSELQKRVKELRIKQGLSQEELAEKTGLSLRTIQRIENGESIPRGDTLKRLSIALQSTPDDLIDWQIQEDNNILKILSLSQLGFLAFPILGIIIPLAI